MGLSGCWMGSGASDWKRGSRRAKSTQKHCGTFARTEAHAQRARMPRDEKRIRSEGAWIEPTDHSADLFRDGCQAGPPLRRDCPTPDSTAPWRKCCAGRSSFRRLSPSSGQPPPDCETGSDKCTCSAADNHLQQSRNNSGWHSYGNNNSLSHAWPPRATKPGEPHSAPDTFRPGKCRRTARPSTGQRASSPIPRQRGSAGKTD